MAGLKGLKKNERADEAQIDIEDFISGAKKRVDALKPTNRKQRKFERYSFSLTQEVSQQIDDLTVNRGFRVARSDVIKAAVLLMSERSEFEVNTVLKRVINEFE